MTISTLAVVVMVCCGRRIGTKADFTTSMCSSSESSDDCSLVELSSMELLILGAKVLVESCGGGLDEELRDEAGERWADDTRSADGSDGVVVVVMGGLPMPQPPPPPARCSRSYGRKPVFGRRSG